MISEEKIEIIEKITITSSIKEISKAEDLVDRVCSNHHFKEDCYGNFLIAVTEAVNNAIIHGSLNDEKKIVFLTVYKNKKHLIFEVKDEGKGFDYNNIEDPTDPKNINKPNGRGVFLMKNLADYIEYIYPGNHVKLYFKLML